MNITEIKKDIAAGTQVNIEDLDLSARTSRLLKEAGVKTVQDAAASSVQFLFDISGFGRKAMKDLEEALGQLGLSLKKETGAATNTETINKALSGAVAEPSIKENAVDEEEKTFGQLVDPIHHQVVQGDFITESQAVPIRTLPFTMNALNMLDKAGIRYINQLETMTHAELRKFPFIQLHDAVAIEKTFNEAGYFMKKEPGELVSAFHEDTQLATDGTKATEDKAVYPSAENIASDLETSKEYLKRRHIDCNQLCADIVLESMNYCRLRKHQDEDFSFFTVMSKQQDAAFFASPHKECVLAYILAKWW